MIDRKPYVLPSQTMLDLTLELKRASDVLLQMTTAVANACRADGDAETLEYILPYITGMEMGINQMQEILRIVVEEQKVEGDHGRA